MNAAAAHHLYGGPVIITDLGTATTFDTVSKEGDYLGGAIAPGILTAAEGLFARAAMLPRVELTRPKQAIGTNTTSAMQSGIILVALCYGPACTKVVPRERRRCPFSIDVTLVVRPNLRSPLPGRQRVI